MVNNIILENYNNNLEKALQFIENNFIYDLSIDELANISGYSSYYFQRLFKKYTKETAHQLILRLRLEQAAFMLKYQKISISDVIYRIGFSCNSTFGRAFKNSFHICPKDYKDYFENYFLSNDTPEFELIILKDFNIFFLRTYGNYGGGELDSCKNIVNYYPELINEKTQYISIRYDEPSTSLNLNKMRYDACILAKDEDLKIFNYIPHKKITAGKYARFRFKGDLYNFNKFFYKIRHTFFHNSSYKIAIKPAILLHHNSFEELISGITITDILIPIE